jgi:hypothetical protein
MRWQTNTLSLLIFIAFLSAFSFYIGTKYQTSAVQDQRTTAGTSSTSAPMPILDGSKQSSALPIARTFLSANQTFAFTAYKIPDEDFCTFNVTNKKGTTEDVAHLLGVTKIRCTDEEKELSSGFQKWIDDKAFLISINGKTLQIDVASRTRTVL